MNIEEVRNYCLSKPYSTEDMPFGPDIVVYRVGGKIFCCLALVPDKVVQLKWNPEEFDEAPIPEAVAKGLIDRAFAYVRGRLPKRTRESLGL